MLNRAEINLKNLKSNALKIKSKLRKGVKLCAVVKADAYGHGAEECASALYKIADMFAVALTEEGAALRRCGIDKDILTLIPPFRQDLISAVSNRLSLTVTSLNDARAIEKEARKQRAVIRIHIKTESGMNRQGVDDADELNAICALAEKSPYLCLYGIYSHLIDAQNSALTEKQILRFESACSVAEKYNPEIIKHLSASGGLIKGLQYGMVRTGILLYGYPPFKTDWIKVKPVMKVSAPVLNVKEVGKGESMLYGEYKTPNNLTRALVRYGYADGLPRKSVTGQLNNRCMDVTAVKKADNLKKFYIIDENVVEIAEKYGTISYEILCSAARRAERVYLR